MSHTNPWSAAPKALQSLAILLIRSYQRFISPVFQAVSGPRCRFHPSCSEYALEAVQKRGFFIGLGLAIWRLMRCQPFAKGGVDPVPPASHHPRLPRRSAA